MDIHFIFSSRMKNLVNNSNELPHFEFQFSICLLNNPEEKLLPVKNWKMGKNILINWSK